MSNTPRIFMCFGKAQSMSQRTYISSTQETDISWSLSVKLWQAWERKAQDSISLVSYDCLHSLRYNDIMSYVMNVFLQAYLWNGLEFNYQMAVVGPEKLWNHREKKTLKMGLDQGLFLSVHTFPPPKNHILYVLFTAHTVTVYVIYLNSCQPVLIQSPCE